MCRRAKCKAIFLHFTSAGEHQSMHNAPTEERIGMWESPKVHSIETTSYLATLGTGDLN